MISNYSLLISTNSYVGNFERELCSYVFGAYYEAQEWVDELRKLFKKEVRKGSELTESLSGFYDEHDWTCCEISSNDKNLIVYFEKDPTPFMDIIVDRLQRFPKVLASSWEFAQKDVEIKKIELFANTVTTKAQYAKTITKRPKN